MKRLQLWGLVGVAVLAGLGYGSWQWWAGPRIAVEVLQRQDVVQTMVASGHVQSPHRTDVSAQVTGRVVAIPVTEGQWVRQGQTLIELDSSEAQANHQQALANSQQAQVNVRQLLELRLPVAEQTLLQAQANLKVAQQSLARSQTLFDKGFVGICPRGCAARLGRGAGTVAHCCTAAPKPVARWQRCGRCAQRGAGGACERGVCGCAAALHAHRGTGGRRVDCAQCGAR